MSRARRGGHETDLDVGESDDALEVIEDTDSWRRSRMEPRQGFAGRIGQMKRSADAGQRGARR